LEIGFIGYEPVSVITSHAINQPINFTDPEDIVFIKYGVLKMVILLNVCVNINIESAIGISYYVNFNIG